MINWDDLEFSQGNKEGTRSIPNQHVGPSGKEFGSP